MLKTIPYTPFSDEQLLKVCPNESIQNLRKKYNPKIIYEGVIESSLNFNHMVNKNVDFASHSDFIVNGDELLEVVSSKEMGFDKFMELIHKSREEGHEILTNYGVADNVDQIIDFYKVNSTDLNICINITPIHKSSQPETGGWRWHKWGSYIGTQKSSHEYLYDEKKVELVYVFHVYEFKE